MRPSRQTLRWLWLLACLFVAGAPAHAAADVARFALVIGNNRGTAADTPLAHAESDAARVHAVLRELGGFGALDAALLSARGVDEARAALVEIEARVRASQARGTDAMLFVFYSGHADAESLHLGEDRWPLTELASLVRSSSATFRLLVVDACRSGALTRVKGGTARVAFALPAAPDLTGEGVAFISATTAGEDAQESDELGGSFFTHAFVSGLLGAADRNHDGLVVLEEAYWHAYDATVRATSRTPHGPQHPTFAYELRGQNGLVLTRVQDLSLDRAALALPRDVGFMILRGDAEGGVVAEVDAQSTARVLSLRPGTYFVRGRGPEFLLEGQVVLGPLARVVLDPRTLNQVAYARLVRKGGASLHRAHALDAGASVHSRTQGADSPCIGATAGYGLELSALTLQTRAGFCHSWLQHRWVAGTTDEYDLSLAAVYAWDHRAVSIALGLGTGVALVHQRFETRGQAPPRLAAEPYVGPVLSLTVDLPAGTFVRTDVRGETHFVRLQAGSANSSALDVSFAARAALLLGAYLR